jgi:hypothetical protein
MDLPDHPRVREIEAERRLLPIGLNCAVNVLRNGSRHVIAFPNTDPNGPGTRQDNPYFGEHPFRVTRTDGQPDVVSMELLSSTDLDPQTEPAPPSPTLLPFGFAMEFSWSAKIPDSPFPEDQDWFALPSGYGQQNPFHNYTIAGWSLAAPEAEQVYGYKSGGTTPGVHDVAIDAIPSLAESPIRKLSAASDGAANALLYGSTGISPYVYHFRIDSVRFFFGQKIPNAGESAGLYGLNPISGPTWQIVWDERAALATPFQTDSTWPADVGASILTTHTFGPFSMAGTETFLDRGTWPEITPSVSWEFTASDSDSEAIFFTGLRIERVS